MGWAPQHPSQGRSRIGQPVPRGQHHPSARWLTSWWQSMSLQLGADKKIITVGRHGEGFHNAAHKEWEERGMDGMPYDLEHDPQFL